LEIWRFGDLGIWGFGDEIFYSLRTLCNLCDTLRDNKSIHQISHRKYFLIFLLFLPILSFSNFDFNRNCQQAMLAILDLRLVDARLIISQEKNLHPENGFSVYLEHYSDCIELIVTEDIRIYNRG